MRRAVFGTARTVWYNPIAPPPRDDFVNVMQETAIALDPARLRSKLLAEVRAKRWFIAIIAVYSLAGTIVVRSSAEPRSLSYGLYLLEVFKLTGLFLIFWSLLNPLYVMVFVRPKHLTRHLLTELREKWATSDRLFRGLLTLVLLPPFLSIYTSLKPLIPSINPYSWDVTFLEWDRALHGNVDPWVLLQPILGHPPVTYGIAFLYQGWSLVMYAVLLWQAFTVHAPRLRMQFLITYLLLWSVLGSLLAIVFSSGGPCYFERLTGLPDPYAPLFEYLKAVDTQYRIPALEVQQRLWNLETGGGIEAGAGISAMPSMHVATSVLFALVAWRRNRRLGVVLWAFAAVIMVGSVHLGWHYAVDGYLSIVLTVLLWRVVGHFVARDPTLGPETPSPAAVT